MCTDAGATASAPMGEYSKRTFSLATGGPTTSLGAIYTFGKIVRLTIDVTTAYNGAGSATTTSGNQSAYNTIKPSDWSLFDWRPVINLKVAGARVYTYPTGWTCNGIAGGCSGDTLGTSPPEQVWLKNSFAPSLNQAITCGGGSGFNCPVVSYIIETDQDVVP